MKIAVVAGGWHFPGHFYREMTAQMVKADLFVVAHRSPDLPIVRLEKQDRLNTSFGHLADIDRAMYKEFLTVESLKGLGWDYQEAPNTVGDWGFFNQWLETHDYRDYDLILNCHDDTYIRSHGLLSMAEKSWLKEKWLILGNGKYPEAPTGYVRGSFEFWSREMLDLLGGKIDLGDITLTREGKTDSPVGMEALSPWNYAGVPLRDFITKHNLFNRVKMLSPYYRISQWAIEGERGFINQKEGAPWSFEAGVKALLPVLPVVMEPIPVPGITVYTVIVNDYDELKPPTVVEPGVKYVCFSDREYVCPPWEIRPCPSHFHDASKDSRYPKILAHRFIDSEYSIYHDGSCVLTTKPSALIKELLSENDLALYRHPVRRSVHEERDACIRLKVHTGDKIAAQVARYSRMGLGLGLWCGGIILRRHTKQMKAFNEIWYREFMDGCVRDQIALPWAVKESGVVVRTIRENITEDQKRFKFHYHKKDAAYIRTRKPL